MFTLKKFRIGVDCNFIYAFNDFIRRNYNQMVFNECQPFIRELSQTRNMLSYLSANQSESMLDSLLSTSVIYIKTLKELNSVAKIDFTVLRIDFSWKEASNDQITKSNNLYYEICSIKYNMAILLMAKGYLNFDSKDKLKLKESYKSFIQAAGLFNEITDLANANYVTKENIPDFSENLLYACKNYALGLGQIAIYRISEVSYGPELLQKLSHGIYILLNKAASCSLSINANRDQIKYYANFYYAKSLIFAKNQALAEWDNTGKGMGKVVEFEELILKYLQECENMKNNVGTQQMHSEVTNLYRTIKAEYDQYYDRNKRIYKDTSTITNEISDLPSLIKAEIPKNTYDLEVSPLASLLQVKNSLINPAIRPMLDRYYNEMKKYIDQNIMNYETPQKIDDFINKRGLTNIFGYKGGSSVLSNEIFRDIQQIQAQGGLNGLLDKVKLLNNEYHSLQNKINNIKNVYLNEELEDQNCKKLYGNKWTVPFDPTYKNLIEQLLGELNEKRRSDIALTSKIMDDRSFYELLKYQRKEDIEANIPKDLNSLKVQSSPIMEELQKNVNNLFDKKNDMFNLITNLNYKIKNNAPLDDFNQASRMIKTESAILEEQKMNLVQDFQKMDALNKDIANLYQLIDRDYGEYSKQSGFQGNIVNNKYMNFFNSLKNNYQMTAMELDRRLRDYNEFGKKVDNISNQVNDHLQARGFVKAEMKENLEHEFRVQMAQSNVKK